MSTTTLPVPHLGPLGRSLLDRIVGSGQRGVLRDQVADWVLARLLQLGYVEEHPLDTALLVSTPAGLQRWQFEMLREEQRAGERMRKDFIRQRIEQRGSALALVPAKPPMMSPALPNPRAGPMILPVPAIAGPAAAVSTSRSRRPRTGAFTLAAGLVAAIGLTVLLLSGLNPSSPWPRLRPVPHPAAKLPVASVTPAYHAAVAQAAAPLPVRQKAAQMRVVEQRPDRAPPAAARHAAEDPAIRHPAGGAAPVSSPAPLARRRAAAPPALLTAATHTMAVVTRTSATAPSAAKPVVPQPRHAPAEAPGAPAPTTPPPKAARAHSSALSVTAATLPTGTAHAGATAGTTAHQTAAHRPMRATVQTPGPPHPASAVENLAPHHATRPVAARLAVARAETARPVLHATTKVRHPAAAAITRLASRTSEPHQSGTAKAPAAHQVAATVAVASVGSKASPRSSAVPTVAALHPPAAAHLSEKPPIARTTRPPHAAAHLADRGREKPSPTVASKVVPHAAARKLSGDAEVDLLNAQSLAAARAGREWHPSKPAKPAPRIRGLHAAGLAGDDSVGLAEGP